MCFRGAAIASKSSPDYNNFWGPMNIIKMFVTHKHLHFKTNNI